MDKTRLLKSSVMSVVEKIAVRVLRYVQSGCYVSRLHFILSANLLRRRICLFGSYECPIFQGNALWHF